MAASELVGRGFGQHLGRGRMRGDAHAPDPYFAAGLAELYAWIQDSGLGSEVTPAVEKLLGREPTPFRKFAVDHRSAWLD
jgi:hypothetical protein